MTLKKFEGHGVVVAPMLADPLQRMKGVNFFLVVATTALFSTGIAEKAHMVAHLSQTPPPNCCCADSINISNLFPTPTIRAVTVDSGSLSI